MAATLLNRIAAADIAQAIAAAPAAGERLERLLQIAPVYEVTNHRLGYLTLDSLGRTVTASGLVSVPVKAAGSRRPGPHLANQVAAVSGAGPYHLGMTMEPGRLRRRARRPPAVRDALLGVHARASGAWARDL